MSKKELEKIIWGKAERFGLILGTDRLVKELSQAILDAGFVKIKPFEWMEQWLKAYDKEHKTNFAKEILDWINQQPMAGG